MAFHSALDFSTPQPARILVVEDDATLRTLLSRTVKKLGHSVSICESAEQAIALFEREPIDLILLDIILPGMNGFSLCEAVRTRSAVPIIAITSLSATEDVVRMLELGADDYITKPFNFTVLEMRIEAQLRRYLATHQPNALGILRTGNLMLNSSERRVTIGQTEIDLTERECSLLRCLMSEPGIPIPIARLYEYVWGQCNGQEKTMVPTVIQRLRSKLEADPVSPSVIVNVRGYGYKFSLPS